MNHAKVSAFNILTHTSCTVLSLYMLHLGHLHRANAKRQNDINQNLCERYC